MKSYIEQLLQIIRINILVWGLFKIMDSGIALSIALIIGGVSTILNGYSLYVKNKKKESISLILGGFLAIILSILSVFFSKL